MAEPLPICYLNGEWPALREARISPLDRSFLFGDGVYEVVPVFEGRPFRFTEHFDRLQRSLAALQIRDPHSRDAWRELVRELMQRNGGGDMYVYVQVSRGAEYGRNHAPYPDVPPTVFAFCAPLPKPSATQLQQGLQCVTAPDIRWARCDIKSVALLGNVMQRQLSAQIGAHETILLKDGQMMEASASTVHVVLGGVIISPPNSNEILPGTTRTVVEELADRIGVPRETRSVSEAELRAADEVWLASATRNVSPVTRIDGAPVGDGRPGPVWQKMWAAFQQLQAELRDQAW
ncbi:MAG: D-amino acid aminotransferase [Sinobacteraceae bacterium]|nr:D-amino acid aminotransferase [Nevskiaceae bacterium]